MRTRVLRDVVRLSPAIAVVLAACGHPAPAAPRGAALAPSPVAAAPAPSPPSCDAIHLSLVETGDAHARARLFVAGEGLAPSAHKAGGLVTRAAVEACQADRWPDVVVRCLADDDLVARARCFDALSDAQRAHLRARVDEAIATIPAVEVVRESREPWRDVPAHTGVPTCDAFLAGVNRLARCRTFPGPLRDQLDEAVGMIALAMSIARSAGNEPPPDCSEAEALARRAAASFACAATR